MDAVAKRAGVTKATLYQRYTDKASLVRAVMYERVETWSSKAEQRVAPRGNTLRERMGYYARSTLYWSQDPEVRAFGRLIRECWGSVPEVAREIQSIRQTRMIDVLEMQIEEFGKRDGDAAKHARRVARIFMGMLTAFSDSLSNDQTTASQDEIDECANAVVNILFDGRRAW